MKKAKRTAPRLTTLGAILTVFLTASALGAADPFCSQATMSGTYVFSGAGAVGVGTTAGSAFAAVGRVTYDGKGGGESTSTASVGGVISKSTATATFTVNSDCTGTKSFSSGTNFDFVITADGREIYWIATNAGTVLSGRAVRLDRSRN